MPLFGLNHAECASLPISLFPFFKATCIAALHVSPVNGLAEPPRSSLWGSMKRDPFLLKVGNVNPFTISSLLRRMGLISTSAHLKPNGLAASSSGRIWTFFPSWACTLMPSSWKISRYLLGLELVPQVLATSKLFLPKR